MGSVLVVINGPPGSGKTTLKQRLAADLAIPAVSKDDLKEQLYDLLGTKDLPWKEMLGRVSIRMLYELADEMLAYGSDLIIENAFFKQFATKDLLAIAEKRDATLVEVFCRVPVEVAKQRFISRQATGERHVGHRDDLHATYIEDPAFWARYEPLRIGEYIELDTAKSDEVAYADLLNKLKQYLKEGS